MAGLLPLSATGAPDGPYDVFSKALAPIASSFFGGGNGQPGAMVAECLVTSATGPLAAAKGTRFRLAVQAPDRMRLDVARDGAKLTACRDGKELWAVPGEPMRALAQSAGIDLGKGPDQTSPPLAPIALNAQMLTLLPMVFDVKDAGSEAGPPARRVLQFSLLPQVRDAIKAGQFDARAWIGSDFHPARLALSGSDYSLEIEIEKIGFADQLDATAWKPAEGDQPLTLPASTLNDLFEKMLGGKPAPAAPGP